MKLSELPPEVQSGFLGTIVRLTYPVYCETGVHDFDYHFIGSGILLRWEKRHFFILTGHQVRIAAGKPIFFAYENASSGIRLSQGRVLEFENCDLVISELQFNEVISGLPSIELAYLEQPGHPEELEYGVLGYQRVLNAVDWENKILSPIRGGIFTDKINIGKGIEPIELDFSGVSVGHVPQLDTFEDLTQGLSGSPVFGFRILEVIGTKLNADFHFMGIATHVAETTRRLYATRTYALLSCLNAGFGVFSEFEQQD